MSRRERWQQYETEWLRKHADLFRKEHIMSTPIVQTQEHFVALCKRIIAGKIADITANQLALLYPGDGLVKLMNDSVVVRKALSLTNPFSLDRLAKQDPDAVDVDDDDDDDEDNDDDGAQDELERLAEERRLATGESREKAFAKVYEQNKALAKRERAQSMAKLYGV
jgi:hypothetical protein